METTEIMNNEVMEETTEMVAQACNGNGKLPWIAAGVGVVAAIGGVIVVAKKFVAPKLAEAKKNHAEKKRNKEPFETYNNVVDVEVSEE